MPANAPFFPDSLPATQPSGLRCLSRGEQVKDVTGAASTLGDCCRPNLLPRTRDRCNRADELPYPPTAFVTEHRRPPACECLQ